MVKNGIRPVNQEAYCKCRYHGLLPIDEGIFVILHGYLIGDFIIQRKLPTKTKGKQTKSQRRINQAICEILKAALDCSKEKTIRVNPMTIKVINGNKKAVNIQFFNHMSPQLFL